ncbi:MAG: SOS response-associated peptidase family protein [Henriciella sp.]|uniref:SOS response-associated peptidase n=1 Tax=Henriciella sp. TaxID=1968823 RepID=UPI003C70ACE8
MCNLYRHHIPISDLRLFVEQLDLPLAVAPGLGNLEPAYVGADQDGPVLHRREGRLALAMMRWGFPPTSARTSTGKWAAPITNIRNLESRWWTNVNRQWLMEAEYRCLVPFSCFAEPVPAGGRSNAWFAPSGQDFAFMAGIWRPWSGDTRLAPVEGKKTRQRVPAELNLYAFLTTEPNGVVAPIHPKAMPVVLTEKDECAEWLSGGEQSLRLQRPLRDELLDLVSSEEKSV